MRLTILPHYNLGFNSERTEGILQHPTVYAQPSHHLSEHCPTVHPFSTCYPPPGQCTPFALLHVQRELSHPDGVPCEFHFGHGVW